MSGGGLNDLNKVLMDFKTLFFLRVEPTLTIFIN